MNTKDVINYIKDLFEFVPLRKYEIAVKEAYESKEVIEQLRKQIYDLKNGDTYYLIEFEDGTSYEVEGTDFYISDYGLRIYNGYKGLYDNSSVVYFTNRKVEHIEKLKN